MSSSQPDGISEYLSHLKDKDVHAEENRSTEQVRSNVLYTVLEHPQSIRLLELEPGKPEDDIVCHLRPASLDEHPPYVALSYAPSDSSIAVPISCNGNRIEVKKEIVNFLRSVRHPENRRIYWVDAICVNKADIQERNSQVRIMKDIWKQADMVAAYVGEETEDMPATIEVLTLLYGASLNEAPREAVEQTLLYGYLTGTNDEIPGSDSPKWDALQNFFRRKFFSSIWGFQAVVLASSDPNIFFGSQFITWKVLSSAARMYHSSQIVNKRPTEDESRNILLVDSYRNASPVEFKRLTLLHLLRSTWTFHSADPRDKIFALYGVSGNVTDENGKSLLEPDYQASVEEVYRQVAVAMVIQRQDLHVLTYVSHNRPKSNSQIPSWTPDWNNMGTALDFLGIGGQFTWWRSFPGECSFSSDYTVLNVSGCLVDNIKYVSEPLGSEKLQLFPEFRHPGALRRLWENQVISLGEQYAAGGTVVEAFWRTLIADNNSQRQKPAQDEWYVHFLSYWRMTRIKDLETEEYMQLHPTRPSIEDEVARREAQKRELEPSSSFCNEDQMAALKKRLSEIVEKQGYACQLPTDPYLIQVFGEKGMLDAKEGCIHCQTVDDPMLLRQVFPAMAMLPLRVDDPTLHMMDDRFVAEWFRRLRNDEKEPIPIIDSDGNAYGSSLKYGILDRTFFITSGGLMGVGPVDAQVGDKIAILARSEEPFILRSRESSGTGGSFTLVGSVYVHGIKNRSFLPVDAEGKPTWSTINLV